MRSSSDELAFPLGECIVNIWIGTDPLFRRIFMAQPGFLKAPNSVTPFRCNRNGRDSKVNRRGRSRDQSRLFQGGASAGELRLIAHPARDHDGLELVLAVRALEQVQKHYRATRWQLGFVDRPQNLNWNT